MHWCLWRSPFLYLSSYRLEILNDSNLGNWRNNADMRLGLWKEHRARLVTSKATYSFVSQFKLRAYSTTKKILVRGKLYVPPLVDFCQWGDIFSGKENINILIYWKCKTRPNSAKPLIHLFLLRKKLLINFYAVQLVNFNFQLEVFQVYIFVSI